MRRIKKGAGPRELAVWKRENPGKRYQDLVGHECVKMAIRDACVSEQHGLCAYCCRAITPEKASSHNEHVEAQFLAPNRTLEFGNIVASCNLKGRCGESHGRTPLPLTPLMAECESELKFELSGLVKGLTERAVTTIEVLNLGSSQQSNRGLVDERRQMISALLYSDLTELHLESDEFLEEFLQDLMHPGVDQRLQPFSPVLVNVIRQMRA